MQYVRAFIAVELSPDVLGRAEDLGRRLRSSGAKVTWVKPGNMHLTLKFLGETPTLEIPDVCQAVADAVADLEPFDVECSRAGAFPSLERPRTLWLGVDDPEGRLAHLQQAVEDRLAAIGYRRENRRFQAHLTFGRVRGGAGAAQKELSRLLAEHASFPPAVSDVSEVTVFSSVLEREGPTYEVLGHSELGWGRRPTRD